MLIIAGLVAATLVSEDAACVGAGLLVQRGEIGALPAVAACAAGIFLGDLGLWALGRYGRHLIQGWPWLARRFPHVQAARAHAWLEARPATAILSSRLLPGTRLPVYVGAGLVGMSWRRFSLWAAVAAAMWAPLPVLISAAASEAVLRAPGAGVLPGWVPLVVAAALMMAALSGAARRAVAGAIERLRPRLARYRRWEFWPAWLFYAPVAAWVSLLALRYRGLTTIAAANPGIPDGGIVGESKFDILARLPSQWTIPAIRVGAGSGRARWTTARAAIEAAGWSLPVVLKPDAGQRGFGVRLAHSWRDVAQYLRRVRVDVLVQPYHAGPGEAGVFYYRHPDEPCGRILAITDKRFPTVTGDGKQTLADLVLAHPRFRLQASLFLRRHVADADRVLTAGERFTLTDIGNHAQGAIFLDGANLWTPALEARIDEIARACRGFYIGRFDVRYRDVEAFKAGRDLAIIELNGATGEPTSIYDPRGSLANAYRWLFRQWSLVFAVGHANRRRGVRPSSAGRILEITRAHLTARQVWDGLD